MDPIRRRTQRRLRPGDGHTILLGAAGSILGSVIVAALNAVRRGWSDLVSRHFAVLLMKSGFLAFGIFVVLMFIAALIEQRRATFRPEGDAGPLALLAIGFLFYTFYGPLVGLIIYGVSLLIGH